MKELKFSTSKGEFILVDSIGRENYYEVLRSEGLQVEHIGMVKEMTEEQFAEVVDSDEISDVEHHAYREIYIDYTNDEQAFETARESFSSLIRSLGWYLFSNNCPSLHHDKLRAESKTLYNPILLKKI